MPNVTIPDALTVIIPLLVTALSHFLRDDKLSSFVNALIAAAAILITAMACAYLSASWSNDMRAQTTIVLAFIGLLAGNEFKVILTWLSVSSSPLSPATTSVQPTKPSGMPTMPLKP